MRSLRILCVVAAAAWSSACFQMTTALKVNGDGSGTIEHRMLYTTAGLEKLRQFASLGGGRGLDPLSEQQAREMTASIGPGVTYVTVGADCTRRSDRGGSRPTRSPTSARSRFRRSPRRRAA
jgi:hypothetical protein